VRGSGPARWTRFPVSAASKRPPDNPLSKITGPVEVSSADGGASGERVRAKRPDEVRARPSASAGRARGRRRGGGAQRRRAAAVIRRGHQGADEVREGEDGAGDQGAR